MASVEVRPLGDGQTRVIHGRSGNTFETDSSPEWGGGGRSFSATDLVAAGLGACIGSSIATPLERRGIDLSGVRVSVDKTVGTDPKRIEHLAVTIEVPVAEDASLEKLLHKVSGLCPVGRSLACGESIHVVFTG